MTDHIHIERRCSRCRKTYLITEAERATWKCPRCKAQPDLFAGDATSEDTTEVGTPADLSATTRRNLRAMTIQQHFERFNAKHPDVYDRLVRLARRWKGAGHSKCGIKMLWEVVRWERGMERVETDDDVAPEFRLCNNLHSRYARRIMEQEPDLDGLFEVRALRADSGSNSDDEGCPDEPEFEPDDDEEDADGCA